MIIGIKISSLLLFCLFLKRKSALHKCQHKYSFALSEDMDKLSTPVWKGNNAGSAAVVDVKIHSNTPKIDDKRKRTENIKHCSNGELCKKKKK